MFQDLLTVFNLPYVDGGCRNDSKSSVEENSDKRRSSGGGGLLLTLE